MKQGTIIALVVSLLVGGVLGFLVHPKAEIIRLDETKYELENEIQKLKYETKLAKIETKFLQRMHFIENADSSQLDSLWTNYGF